LSKKAAAGSTHVLIDIPFGPAAKVREERTALRLSQRLRTVGKRLGLHVAVVITDGSQPVGWGIGPALEARDVLAVLQCSPQAPRDLRERALMLAANVLELGGAARHGEGRAIAASALDSGRAWAKFQAICKAQGGLGTPPVAPHTLDVPAERDGVIAAIDNLGIARMAKLAGAPNAPAAGIALQCHIGQRVQSGEPLFTIHAQTPGELAYALAFMQHRKEPVIRMGKLG
ncbi:MAG: thymidine phosphorylase, partial [Gammaproteobacteria bacterium]